LGRDLTPERSLSIDEPETSNREGSASVLNVTSGQIVYMKKHRNASPPLTNIL
jgi:hypothetical protein